MNKENCTLKLVDEIILYYDARSKKHRIPLRTQKISRAGNREGNEIWGSKS